MTLAFTAGAIESGDTAQLITYTDEAGAVDANDVRDTAGNQAQSPESHTVAFPPAP